MIGIVAGNPVAAKHVVKSQGNLSDNLFSKKLNIDSCARNLYYCLFNSQQEEGMSFRGRFLIIKEETMMALAASTVLFGSTTLFYYWRYTKECVDTAVMVDAIKKNLKVTEKCIEHMGEHIKEKEAYLRDHQEYEALNWKHCALEAHQRDQTTAFFKCVDQGGEHSECRHQFDKQNQQSIKMTTELGRYLLTYDYLRCIRHAKTSESVGACYQRLEQIENLRKPGILSHNCATALANHYACVQEAEREGDYRTCVDLLTPCYEER